MEEITAQVRAMQVAADLFDDASAATLGINRTDQRVLDILDQDGPMTAGHLAERNHLSPAAMTTSIDRLEAKGYARRFADPGDRRRVLVEVTPLALRRTANIYVPLGEDGARAMSRYTVAELEVILRFFNDAANINERGFERLREQGL
jgi:DNA-binding MarR family transcriptional regulator